MLMFDTTLEVPERIISISLLISLLVFGLRVLANEVKAVLGDWFKIVEFTIRWWIFICEMFEPRVTWSIAPPRAE
jgi:hypothetical protein